MTRHLPSSVLARGPGALLTTVAAAALLLAAVATQPSVALAAPGCGPALYPASFYLPTAPPTTAHPIVAIDAGHGGEQSGALHFGLGDAAADVKEKDINLTIALKLAFLLEKDGYRPVLTRRGDEPVNAVAADLTGDGRVDNDDDLQARVDIANAAGADILVSIHNNGSPWSQTRGTSVWYALAHTQGAKSRLLARLVQANLVQKLKEAGYSEVLDEGAKDDPPLKRPYGHLFLVGPKTPRVARPSRMPSVLVEALYVTSDRESALLKSDAVLTAIALGLRDGVEQYFGRCR